MNTYTFNFRGLDFRFAVGLVGLTEIAENILMDKTKILQSIKQDDDIFCFNAG